MRLNTVRPRLRSFLALGLAMIAMSAVGQNSSAAPEQQPLPKFRAASRLVVVDVITTDPKGKPITALKKEDFVLLEDGKPQQIKVFGFQSPQPPPDAATTSQPAATTSAVPKLPEHVFTNVPTYKSTGALNVILMDWLNTPNLNQTDARLRLIKVLDQMPAGRPVAIYLLGSRLRLIQDFTSDQDVLRQVVAGINSKNSPNLPNPVSDATASIIPSQIAQYIPAANLQKIIQFESRNQAAQINDRVQRTLQGMNELTQTLAAYPGRKNLIWISEAFPLQSALISDVNFENRDTASDFRVEVARVADRLMSSQIAVYPIDVRGLTAVSDLFQIGNDGHDEYGRPLRGDNLLHNEQKLSENLSNAHGTMDDLADQTGGHAYYNTSDFGKVILASMEDGSTYYTLGYYPDNKNWDGKFRKLQIKSTYHGAKLRYRLGYFASSPMAYQTESDRQRAIDLGKAIDLASPASTSLLFQAQVLPPSAQTQNKIRVSFAIDPHGVSFDLANDDLYHADLSCVVQVFSDKGDALHAESFTVTTGLKPPDYDHVMKTYVPCRLNFVLPPGDYPLRLAVRDEHTGAIGTANARVTVTADTATAAQPH